MRSGVEQVGVWCRQQSPRKPLHSPLSIGGGNLMLAPCSFGAARTFYRLTCVPTAVRETGCITHMQVKPCSGSGIYKCYMQFSDIMSTNHTKESLRYL